MVQTIVQHPEETSWLIAAVFGKYEINGDENTTGPEINESSNPRMVQWHYDIRQLQEATEETSLYDDMRGGFRALFRNSPVKKQFLQADPGILKQRFLREDTKEEHERRECQREQEER